MANSISSAWLFQNSKKHAKDFSLGQRQRLGIAMALVGDPKLLILDEPTNGLDPEGIREIRELLLNLNQQGITILISSHILSELSKLATDYTFIDNGKIIKEISAHDLETASKRNLEIKTDDDSKAKKILLDEGFQLLGNRELTSRATPNRPKSSWPSPIRASFKVDQRKRRGTRRLLRRPRGWRTIAMGKLLKLVFFRLRKEKAPMIEAFIAIGYAFLMSSCFLH
jgi:ABC-type multidrug transport system ATPase subunit